MQNKLNLPKNKKNKNYKLALKQITIKTSLVLKKLFWTLSKFKLKGNS